MQRIIAIAFLLTQIVGAQAQQVPADYVGKIGDYRIAQLLTTGAGKKPSAGGCSAVFALAQPSSSSVKGIEAVNTTYSFTSVDIGATDPNRITVVGIGSRTNGGTTDTITGVVIDGVTATQASGAYRAPSNLVITDVWAANTPSGTTTNATITVTYSAAQARSAIAVYRVVSCNATGQNGTGFEGGGSGLSLPFTVPSGGALMAVYFCRGSFTTATWTAAFTADNFIGSIGGAGLGGIASAHATASASGGVTGVGCGSGDAIAMMGYGP